jgi:signal transduction histidine kinase
VVSIVDNGEGIPDSIRDRIFDPFFTTKAIGHGTGLGLDIVRRLVRHNAGDISVESRPGRTEFCVALPVADHDNPRAGS